MIVHGDFRNFVDSAWDNAYIVSDPPYNQQYHYENYQDNLSPENYELLLKDAFFGRKAVIVHYPEETINILGKILGKCKQVVSWVYPSNTAKQHRLISWWNCKPDFRKEKQAYRNPKDKRIIQRIQDGHEARLYDWWEINQVKNVSKKENPHPCPIPYELARRIISITTQENDLVIDPFAGSGTVIKAALDLKRRAIGYELLENYAIYAQKIVG